MFLAVDIGGTKTLLACFNADGTLLKTAKFETNQNYKQFLEDFESNLSELGDYDYSAACVAVPGRLDRKHGRALGFGTLKWPEIAIEADIEKIINCPVIIENDSKLAGLSEAILILKDYKHVLYVTIGTGISSAVILNGKIDPAMADSEGGQIWLEHKGKRIQWEDLSSGKAIVKQFGKRAEDIQDEKDWKTIAHNLSVGLVDLIAVIQPEVIIIGGGVGQYYERFGKFLEQYLKKYETPLTPRTASA
jgi:predicted NBD/HSP70 family sugar kinase